MSQTETNKKKLRALLNTLREKSIYRDVVPLRLEGPQITFRAIELKENGFRDLAETKSLYGQASGPLPSEVHLLITEGNEAFSIPAVCKQLEADLYSLSFKIVDARTENRREKKREKTENSYFTPALIQIKNSNLLPITGFAKVVDADEDAIAFEIRLPIKIERAELESAVLEGQPQLFLSRCESADVIKVRNITWEDRFDHTLTHAIIVCSARKPVSYSSATPSVIQPQKPITTRFKFFLTGVVHHHVTLNTLYTDGFLGTIDDASVSSLPKNFLAEHRESQIKFQVETSDDGLHFRIATTDIGARIQWYNFTSAKALNVQTKFLPEDTEEITRLMIESGNYTPHAVSNILILHDYLKSNWPIEESLSKTKFRWIARDSEGSIIGHTAGLQVSNRLWAAIDNIGSQSYEGSWNREFVVKWIHAFQEILEPYPDALVQWTFHPAAGVWTRFDESILRDREQYLCRDRILSLFFDNINYEATPNDAYTIEPISSSDLFQNLEIGHIKLDAQEMLTAICDLSPGKTFEKNFEADFGFQHIRYFYRVSLEGQPLFILTFTNYPSWASLNKAHDWAYLFPICYSRPNENMIFSILNIIRSTIARTGSTPFRVGIVTNELKIPTATEYINLFIKPRALGIAAESIGRL